MKHEIEYYTCDRCGKELNNKAMNNKEMFPKMFPKGIGRIIYD